METKALPSLKLMAEGKIEGISKMTIFTVDPDLVEFEEGFNLREEGPELDAHLEALYHAMKSGANIPPIDVSVIDGRIVARDGHCRTRTARRLKAEGVPYQLQARQFRGNDADCVVHMIASAQGKSLTPLEAGRGFLRLLNYNLKVADICRRTGLSRTTVDNGIALAETPAEVQKMITSGQVSTQVVLNAISKYKGDPNKVLVALKFVIKVANEKGVKKVTTKHVSGPRVPKKVVQSLVSTAGNLETYVSKHFNPNFLHAVSEDDATIAVPVAIVKELLAAHASIQPKDEL